MNDDPDKEPRDPFGPAPSDRVPYERDAHTGARLREADGSTVTLITHEITEDLDGIPTAICEYRLTGTLHVPSVL